MLDLGHDGLFSRTHRSGGRVLVSEKDCRPRVAHNDIWGGGGGVESEKVV